MNLTSRSSKLRLVKKPTKLDIDWSTLRDQSFQHDLFGSSKSNLIAFVETSGLPGKDFLFAIDAIRPNVIVDARLAPRFDFDELSRKIVFDVFDKKSIFYFEASSLFDASDLHRTQLGIESFGRAVTKLKEAQRLHGPILFLVKEYASNGDYLRFMPGLVRGFGAENWEVFVLPSE